jgi:hypothetical protein
MLLLDQRLLRALDRKIEPGGKFVARWSAEPGDVSIGR